MNVVIFKGKVNNNQFTQIKKKLKLIISDSVLSTDVL